MKIFYDSKTFKYNVTQMSNDEASFVAFACGFTQHTLRHVDSYKFLDGRGNPMPEEKVQELINNLHVIEESLRICNDMERIERTEGGI
jgi:hypothetical protein